MADFTLSIADGDIAKVTSDLCSPFSIAVNSTGFFKEDGTLDVSAVKARQLVIDIIQQIVLQVETEKAKASIVSPTIT
jgi:hypothetical protein